MPSKLLLRDFEAGHYYHLRHEGKAGSTLFETEKDYQTFILLLSYYLRFPSAAPLSWVSRLDPKTVIAKQKDSMLGSSPTTLHAFVLAPDHFHLVLRENAGAFHPGISNLMRRVSVGYAMYVNKSRGAKGTIYHGKYKNIDVPQDQVGPLVGYLHAHPEINSAFLATPLHSSRPDYIGTPRGWITPLPTDSSISISPKITLEK